MHDYWVKFFTPGFIKTRVALTVSIGLMCLIFVMDWFTGADIRLGALYVVPMGIAGLHCSRRSLVILLAFATACMQCIFYVMEGLMPGAVTTDTLADLIAELFVAYLATEVLRNYMAMQSLAQTDMLTKLANRRSFEARLTAEIYRHRRYGGSFSLMHFDLDHFKQLNDTQGHAAGDRALVVVGEVLAHSTRLSDSTARLGGDEFVVLLPNTTPEQCKKVAQKLLERIEERMTELNFGVTASMGAVTFATPPKSIAAALEQVDKAMYAAKAAGRNQVVFG